MFRCSSQTSSCEVSHSNSDLLVHELKTGGNLETDFDSSRAPLFAGCRRKGVHVSSTRPERGCGRLPPLWQRHHPRPHRVPHQRWPPQHPTQVPHQHPPEGRLSAFPHQQRGSGGAGGRSRAARGVHASRLRPRLQRWPHPVPGRRPTSGGAADQENLHSRERWDCMEQKLNSSSMFGVLKRFGVCSRTSGSFPAEGPDPRSDLLPALRRGDISGFLWLHSGWQSPAATPFSDICKSEPATWWRFQKPPQTFCALYIQTMVVHIFPVKDQLPVEVPGSVRSLTVKETEVVFITQAHLHFTDSEDPEADLTFIITQPCFSPTRPEWGERPDLQDAEKERRCLMFVLVLSFQDDGRRSSDLQRQHQRHEERQHGARPEVLHTGEQWRTYNTRPSAEDVSITSAKRMQKKQKYLKWWNKMSPGTME